MDNSKFLDSMFDALPFGVYVVDSQTYDIKYMNDNLENRLAFPESEKCWEKIYGQEEPCPWCKVNSLTQAPDAEITFELFNEADNKWYQLTEKNIDLEDGKKGKYSVGVDITAQKEDQGKLIETRVEIAVKSKELEKAKKEIEELHNYDTDQQTLARNKQVDIVTNQLEEDPDFKTKIFYQSSDILSGDVYSIYKLDENNIFYYIIDGQGHGILPSLTTFSTATTINNYASHMNNMEHMVERVMETLLIVLDDCEQLSYSLIHLDLKNNIVKYSIGGMYTTFLETSSEIIELKANSIPAMIYTKELKISTKEFDSFKGIITYSDGLVEEEFEGEVISAKDLLIDDEKFEKTIAYLDGRKTDDDITVVHIEKIG
jgi:serine phosphatase RsbU (regulator of sigma subunit)